MKFTKIALFIALFSIPLASYAQLSAGGGGVSYSNRASVVIAGGTKFTTSGAGCTVTGTTGGSTAGSFTTSTTGTCTTTITMNGATGLAAPNGWSCYASDITSGVAGAQSGSSATTAQLKIATTSGDTVQFGCIGF